MIVTLNKAEISRAVQYYVARKTGVELRDCDVRLQLKARAGPQAIVTVLRPVPVLNDAVPTGEEA